MNGLKRDKDGRLYIAFHDVRGALVSAIANPATGTATQLVAGDADYFLDLVEISMANQSNVGASVALVQDGTTLRTIEVPPGATIMLKFDVPLEQVTKGLPWNVDMEDITGTTVNIGAYFLKRNK